MEIFEAFIGILGYWRILLPIAITGLGAHFLGLFESNGILEETVLLFVGFLVGLFWESQAGRDSKIWFWTLARRVGRSQNTFAVLLTTNRGWAPPRTKNSAIGFRSGMCWLRYDWWAFAVKRNNFYVFFYSDIYCAMNSGSVSYTHLTLPTIYSV